MEYIALAVPLIRPRRVIQVISKIPGAYKAYTLLIIPMTTFSVVLIQYSIPPILKRKLLGIGIGMKFLVSPTNSGEVTQLRGDQQKGEKREREILNVRNNIVREADKLTKNSLTWHPTSWCWQRTLRLFTCRCRCLFKRASMRASCLRHSGHSDLPLARRRPRHV